MPTPRQNPLRLSLMASLKQTTVKDAKSVQRLRAPHRRRCHAHRQTRRRQHRLHLQAHRSPRRADRCRPYRQRQAGRARHHPRRGERPRSTPSSTCSRPCVASGIDNALIEINANEPPIGDGSGKLFVDMLEQAGKQELDATVTEYELHEPVRVTGRDGGYIIAWPSDRFEVSCTNANHLGKHTSVPHLESRDRQLREGNRAGPHLRLLRGSPAAHGKGSHQGRQPRKRRCHPRRRHPFARAAPLRRRVRPPQDPRHHRRPESLPRCGSRPTFTPSSRATRSTSSLRRKSTSNTSSAFAQRLPLRKRLHGRRRHGHRRHHEGIAAPLPVPHGRPHPQLRRPAPRSSARRPSP